MTDLTPNLKLEKVPANTRTWADKMNENMVLIDAAVGAYFVLQNLQGIWENSHAYTVGQTVVDGETAAVWTCQVAHTSAGIPATFAQERAANSTFWSVYSSPARARGIWLPNTSYAVNDFVVNSSQYAVCIATHISGTDFDNDVASGYWSILVDLSQVGQQVLPVLSGAADANKFVITNSSGTGYNIFDVLTTLGILGASSFGIAVLQASSAAAARSAIDAQVAGSYQNLSTYLSAISGLAVTANTLPYINGSSVAATASITTFGRSLIDDANAAAGRTTLGLGTAAVVDTGTTANKVVVLDASAKLPAVDGSQLTNMPSDWEIGDVKLRYAATAGTGWLLMNDGTIGKAGSGATYASADYQDLYEHLYGEISDTWAPVSGGRTGNATNDFNAGKTLTLSKILGRTLAGAGAGSGLTSRALGESLGAETVTAEMPAHTHSTWRIIATTVNNGYTGADSPVNMLTDASFDNGGTTGSQSSGDGNMSVMQPTSFLNVFIRYL